MLFAEYTTTANTLSVTLQAPTECGDCSICVERDRIDIRSNSGSYAIAFSDLSIAPVTCNNLCNVAEDLLSCSFSASRTEISDELKKCTKVPVNHILSDADSLLCKFCHNTIAHIKDMKKFKSDLSVLSLEESGSGIEENYFCHSTGSQDQRNKPVCIPLSKADIDSTSITPYAGLHTGTEVLLPPQSIQPDCFKHQLGKYYHCAHCLMALGYKGNSETYALWTNCLDALVEELDIDGDFLRHIEKPLSEETDFYASLIDKLIENQCYRIILSAVTWHGCIDFMLLWLIDQKVWLYTTALPKPQSSADQNQSAHDETAVNLKLESSECRRVFYRLVMTADGDEHPNDDKLNLLDIWKRDFSVYLLALPWETCIGLASCLQKFTHRIAPHLRYPEQQMTGFSSGAVPLIS